MLIPLQRRGVRNACERRSPLEQFDVLDCNGRKTGARVCRDEAHANAVWHGAFHCLVIYKRAGRDFALFQKRSEGKTIAPGKFDVSVGGHYAAGEDALTAGPREIREEIGLDVRYVDLVPIGRRIFLYCFMPGVREYEFQDVYLLPRSIDPGNLALQREELDGVAELELEKGINLFADPSSLLEISLSKPDGNIEQVTISAGDFVPCLDNYYLKLLLLARRYLNGERGALVI